VFAVIGALSATAQCLTWQMHGFHGHAPRLPPAGKRMIRTMGFYAQRILRLSHTYGCHNSRRAAHASCAWCDLCPQLLQAAHGATKKKPQHTSFLLMPMPGWTFINMYAHDRDQRHPAIEGFQGG
jgi:hypothetical protein